MNDGGSPQKVNITITTENKSNTEHILPINSGATEFELSPNGKEIKVKVKREKGNVIVCVQDFGIGIAKEEQKKVFELNHFT